MNKKESKIKIERKPKQVQEPVRRWDSQENDVYLTPQHIIDQKVRRNCAGRIVRKKPVAEDNDDVDDQNYTLARVESCNEEIPQPSKKPPPQKPSRRIWNAFVGITKWRCRRSTLIIGVFCILLVVIGAMGGFIVNLIIGNYYTYV